MVELVVGSFAVGFAATTTWVVQIGTAVGLVEVEGDLVWAAVDLDALVRSGEEVEAAVVEAVVVVVRSCTQDGVRQLRDHFGDLPHSHQGLLLDLAY